MQSRLIKGLDIGSSKITLIVGQYYPEEDKLNIVGVASTSSLGFKKGQLTNPEQATQNLKQLKNSVERMVGTKIDSVHLAITNPSIETMVTTSSLLLGNVSREVTITDKQKIIESSTPYDLSSEKSIIHLLPQQFSLDNQTEILDPIGMLGQRLGVASTIVLANSNQITNLKKILNLSGLNVDTISYAGYSASFAALNTTDKELGVALVDIGGHETSVTVFQNQALTQAFVVPVGGSHITNDLAIGLRLTLEEAEQLKQQLSTYLPEQEEIDLNGRKVNLSTAVNGIIKPRLEDLFLLIQQKLNTNLNSNNLNSGLIFSGGGSQSPNCLPIANKILQLPVRLGTIDNVGGLVEDIQSPGFLSSLGLIRQHIHSSAPNTKSGSKDSLFTTIKKLAISLLP